MKAIITIIFILFIGVAAQAQDAKEVKVVTVEKTVVIKTSEETKVARLYKFKNSRVKKALSFTTKRNKAKLA